MEKAKESMYRILIVDDEKNHRKGLMNLIQDFYSQVILLEAADGTDALTVMEYIDCDIIIADIQMVNMDGLTLLRLAKEKKPDVEVVILSGYGQFEYAREAMRHSAAGYLMKPVDKAEIKEVLEKLMNKLEEKKQSQILHRKIEDSLTRTMPVYVEHMMNLLIQEEDFDIKGQLADLFPLRRPGYFLICSLRRTEEPGSENRQRLKYTVKKCLDPYSSYAFYWEKHPQVLVVCVLADFMPAAGSLEPVRCCLEREYGGCCSLYVGRYVENLFDQAIISFDEAQRVWQYDFYQQAVVLNWDMIREKSDEHGMHLETNIMEIVRLLKHQENVRATEIFLGIMDNICKVQYPSPAMMKQKTAFMLFQVARNLEAFFSSSFKDEINQRLDELLLAENFERLTKGAVRFLQALSAEMEKGKGKRENIGKDVMIHCKEYLDSHYMEEVSLDSMAEKYYFNPSYFSSLFRNSFHKNFSEYLIELRMNKARELLENSNSKIREIALLSGYRDANYFVRSFKRHHGFTPEEYRKMRGTYEED